MVVGTLKGKDALRIDVPVDGAGGRQTLAWNVAPAKSNDDNNYLGSLVEAARAAGGANLPLVGSASLEEARREIQAGGRGLTQVARTALASGNLDAADQLAGEALRRDPGDPEAMTIQRAAAKKRALGGAAVQLAAAPVPPPPTPQGSAPAATAGDGLNLVGDGVPPGVGGPGEGAAAEAFGQEKRAIQTIAQTEVQNAISQARGQMGANPQLAIQNLRMELEKMKQLPELSAEARDQIVGSLQAALREGARRLTEFEQRQQQRQEEESKAKEQEILIQNLVRTQQRVKQVMDRFDSLMLEGNYEKADELAAEAAKLAPNSSVPVAAGKMAEFSGYYHDNVAMSAAAQKGIRRHALPGRSVAHPLPRRSADRLSGPGLGLLEEPHLQGLEGVDPSAEGPVQFDGPGETRTGGEEDQRGPEVADAIGVRRYAVDRRHRLPEGLPPDRNPVGQEGHGRGVDRPGHAGEEEPEGDLLEVGPAADAQRTGADLHHPGRSAADHHEGSGRAEVDDQGLPGGRPRAADPHSEH